MLISRRMFIRHWKQCGSNQYSDSWHDFVFPSILILRFWNNFSLVFSILKFEYSFSNSCQYLAIALIVQCSNRVAQSQIQVLKEIWLAQTCSKTPGFQSIFWLRRHFAICRKTTAATLSYSSLTWFEVYYPGLSVHGLGRLACKFSSPPGCIFGLVRFYALQQRIVLWGFPPLPVGEKWRLPSFFPQPQHITGYSLNSQETQSLPSVLEAVLVTQAMVQLVFQGRAQQQTAMNSNTPVSAAPRKNCLPLLVVFFPLLTPAQAQVLRSHFCLPGCASSRGEGSVYVASGECPLLPGRPWLGLRESISALRASVVGFT